jgi:hypothetical protein
MGPAEKACREFEERTAGWERNGERLEKYGRRRWNLAERLEYIRLRLNELHEDNEDEDWNNINGMIAIHFVREYLDIFDLAEWKKIDEERAREDREGT